MEYFVFFNLLILVLFFLSRFLTSEIYAVVYQITHSEKISSNILAFIFFPGVVVHEMSHYLSAKLLGVPTGKISLIPKREGNYIKLGSVTVAESNILKEFIIGAAPLLVGISIILGIIYLVLSGGHILQIFSNILAIYAIFVISNTMYASRKDFQAALPFLATIITIGVVLFIIGFRLPYIEISWLPDIEVAEILYTSSLYLGVPIVLDLAIVLILRFFNRVW